jgi:hypothetical protein
VQTACPVIGFRADRLVLAHETIYSMQTVVEEFDRVSRQGRGERRRRRGIRQARGLGLTRGLVKRVHEE